MAAHDTLKTILDDLDRLYREIDDLMKAGEEKAPELDAVFSQVAELHRKWQAIENIRARRNQGET